jgi:hypothetical protein
VLGNLPCHGPGQGDDAPLGSRVGGAAPGPAAPLTHHRSGWSLGTCLRSATWCTWRVSREKHTNNGACFSSATSPGVYLRVKGAAGARKPLINGVLARRFSCQRRISRVIWPRLVAAGATQVGQQYAAITPFTPEVVKALEYRADVRIALADVCTGFEFDAGAGVQKYFYLRNGFQPCFVYVDHHPWDDQPTYRCTPKIPSGSSQVGQGYTLTHAGHRAIVDN